MEATPTTKLTAAELAEAKSYLIEYGKDALAYYLTESEHYLENENIEVLKFLFSQGADVRARNDYGATSLHGAAGFSQDIEVVKFLVAQGADVHARNNNGATPLHDAAGFNKDIEVVKFLVAQGADVNVKDNSGETPLHAAARTNATFDIVEFLVSQGANVNVRDNEGYFPLHWAVQGGDERFGDAEPRPFSRLFQWAQQEDMDNDLFREGALEVIELFSQGVDIHAKIGDGRTPLHLAAVGGDLDVIELLIFKGANVNEKDSAGATPLHLAAFAGNTDVVMLLVLKGAATNIRNKRGKTAFDMAVRADHLEIVDYLAPITRDTVSKLTVRQQRNADVYLWDDGSSALLQYLLETNKREDENLVLRYVKYFVFKGVDVNAKDVYGQTPLDLAVQLGYTAIAKYLAGLNSAKGARSWVGE